MLSIVEHHGAHLYGRAIVWKFLASALSGILYRKKEAGVLKVGKVTEGIQEGGGHGVTVGAGARTP